MQIYFTKHARKKFLISKVAGFRITKTRVKNAVISPLKLQDRQDGTFIATVPFDEKHVLRVVYRIESDIIVIITFHPGRRKRYEV